MNRKLWNAESVILSSVIKRTMVKIEHMTKDLIPNDVTSILDILIFSSEFIIWIL